MIVSKTAVYPVDNYLSVKKSENIDVCKFPKKEGTTCSSGIIGIGERWYFDQSIRACQKFFYQGCDGNENSFNSQASCEKMCTDNKKKILDISSIRSK